MNRFFFGRGLMIAVAVLSIVVPVGVDGVLFVSAHMQNPLWPPHAKLHTAMSFHAAIALGAGSLALIAARWRQPGGAELAIAAFLATAFWGGLVLARLWPGTSYSFAGDPAFAGMTSPVVLGLPINPNAALSVVLFIAGWLGFALAASGPGPARTGASRLRVREGSQAAPRG